MAAIVIPWFTSIPSFHFAWAPVIIAVPTFIIPRAVFVSPAATAATFLRVVVARVAGIIGAWVIEALT
jgi:hypothetical protein